MVEPQKISQLPAAPARPDNAHKGTFGTVIVLGGCPTMIGAPAIAARAALRTGAGLVKLAATAEVLPFAITIEPGATGILLPEALEEKLAALDQADPGHRAVLAIGPGMGQADPLRKLITTLIRGPRPLVLDADGLNLLAATGQRHLADGPPLVMSPHPGEFKRLAQPFAITVSPTDETTRIHAAVALARVHAAVVVLKGPGTVVTDGRRVFINHTGNPALSTAGSGDVLTGVIAGLIAQGMTPLDAAILAVHVHGRAADIWAAHHGRSGMLARELADNLPAPLQAARPGHRPD